MVDQDARALVLEEWFRLPESRRSHATDAVAFAFRLLRDQPQLYEKLHDRPRGDSHELIANWLMPHLAKTGAGDLPPATVTFRHPADPG